MKVPRAGFSTDDRDHVCDTARIRRALPHVDADKIIVAPDCGLKDLPRAVAFGKMNAMADGAAIVRAKLA